MNKNTSNRNVKNNIWSQRFEIPAWILTIIVIVLILATMPRIEIPRLLLIAIVILLMIIGLFSGRKSPSGGEIKLSNSLDHEITLSNVPENVTPKLLDIDNEDELRNYDKDGTGEILFIAGNLVFYETNSDNLVTSFPSPIRLTFNYTAGDEQKFFSYRKTNSGQEDKLIPIYLYSHIYEDKERPEIHIWKPFQNFWIDEANRTMTIEFLFWGDQPIGGGTRTNG